MTLDTSTSPLEKAGRAKVFAFYGGMIVIAVVAFLLLRSAGDQLTAPPGAGLSQAAGRSINSTLFQALLALGVIIPVLPKLIKGNLADPSSLSFGLGR